MLKIIDRTLASWATDFAYGSNHLDQSDKVAFSCALVLVGLRPNGLQALIALVTLMQSVRVALLKARVFSKRHNIKLLRWRLLCISLSYLLCGFTVVVERIWKFQSFAVDASLGFYITIMVALGIFCSGLERIGVFRKRNE